MAFDIKILTLFPEIFPGPLGLSVTGNAARDGVYNIDPIQIRSYAHDKHKSVDDTPYGGGNGMVMKPDVLGEAIEENFLTNDNSIIYLSPRGERFNQQMAHDLANEKGLNILCGRFEGIDERVILRYKLREISLGDFVLTSGDIAALVFLDAIIRLIPGALESSEALKEESFAVGGEYKNLLEYPHFTRPFDWRGMTVPEVLISGNHAAIKKWRLEQAIDKTRVARPDLLDQYNSKNGD